jgi:hypothetical protein
MERPETAFLKQLIPSHLYAPIVLEAEELKEFRVIGVFEGVASSQ